jgi:tetratricopeptide (TPR) repeat protein
MRSLVLLGAMVFFLPQGGFAQAPPSAEVSAAQAEIAQNPNFFSSYIKLANAENDANHPDEAIAAASHALAMPYTERTGVHDVRPIAYYALAFAYTQKGDFATALSQVDAGLSRYPGSPLLSDEKGRLLLTSGQYSRASEVLLPAFLSVTHFSDPKAVAAWGYVWNDPDLTLGYYLVLSQYYAGQYPQALESARQLVALHDLGSVCVNPEFIPEINKQCTELVRNIVSIDGHDVVHLRDSFYAVKPLLTGPVGSVAEVTYMYSGKIVKMKMVRQAVPLTQDDAHDFALLALALNANGDRVQAFAMARKAIGLNPNDFWAEFSYGLVLEDSNRPNEALKALEILRPIATSVNTPMMEALRQIHRAVLYARKGDMAKAQEIYLAAADHIDPNCLPAVKEKAAFLAPVMPMVNAHLAMAKQLDAQGKYAESLPEYAQALDFAANEQEASTLRAAMFAASAKMPTPPEMPEDAHRHVVRGELMLKDGNFDRALAEFNEALRIAPYMPMLYKNTALIYGELKQYDQAIRQMHLYLTAAPEAPDARAAKDEITKWEMRLEMEEKR